MNSSDRQFDRAHLASLFDQPSSVLADSKEPAIQVSNQASLDSGFMSTPTAATEAMNQGGTDNAQSQVMMLENGMYALPDGRVVDKHEFAAMMVKYAAYQRAEQQAQALREQQLQSVTEKQNRYIESVAAITSGSNMFDLARIERQVARNAPGTITLELQAEVVLPVGDFAMRHYHEKKMFDGAALKVPLYSSHAWKELQGQVPDSFMKIVSVSSRDSVSSLVDFEKDDFWLSSCDVKSVKAPNFYGVDLFMPKVQHGHKTPGGYLNSEGSLNVPPVSSRIMTNTAEQYDAGTLYQNPAAFAIGTMGTLKAEMERSSLNVTSNDPMDQMTLVSQHMVRAIQQQLDCTDEPALRWFVPISGEMAGGSSFQFLRSSYEQIDASDSSKRVIVDNSAVANMIIELYNMFMQGEPRIQHNPTHGGALIPLQNWNKFWKILQAWSQCPVGHTVSATGDVKPTICGKLSDILSLHVIPSVHTEMWHHHEPLTHDQLKQLWHAPALRSNEYQRLRTQLADPAAIIDKIEIHLSVTVAPKLR